MHFIFAFLVYIATVQTVRILDISKHCISLPEQFNVFMAKDFIFNNTFVPYIFSVRRLVQLSFSRLIDGGLSANYETRCSSTCFMWSNKSSEMYAERVCVCVCCVRKFLWHKFISRKSFVLVPNASFGIMFPLVSRVWSRWKIFDKNNQEPKQHVQKPQQQHNQRTHQVLNICILKLQSSKKKRRKMTTTKKWTNSALRGTTDCHSFTMTLNLIWKVKTIKNTIICS